MCTLRPSKHKVTSHCELSKNVTAHWNWNFPFNTSSIESYSYMLRSSPPPPPPTPFSIHLFILLAIWAWRNESICIERTGGCETPAHVWIAALRAGKISKVRTIQTAGGAGIWADIKRWLCVGFSAVLQRKNVNPVSVRLRIINSKTSERSTTNTNKKKDGKKRGV